MTGGGEGGGVCGRINYESAVSLLCTDSLTLNAKLKSSRSHSDTEYTAHTLSLSSSVNARRVVYTRGAGWLHFYPRQDSSLFTTGLPRDPPTQPQPPPAREQHPCRWWGEGLKVPWLGYIGPHGGLAGA